MAATLKNNCTEIYLSIFIYFKFLNVCGKTLLKGDRGMGNFFCKCKINKHTLDAKKERKKHHWTENLET